MQSTNQPSKFPIPWAGLAGSSYIRAIPTASQTGGTPGAASLTDGFPPLNSVPIAAGGVPPFMQDMNGILNIITAWLQWHQAGGPIAYDSKFQASVGGYPFGAVVQSVATGGLFWQSTVENNTSNPDAGGSGWISANSGRLINIRSFATAGTYTYVPTPGIRTIIVTVIGGGGAGGGVALPQGGYGVGAGGASGSLGKSRIAIGSSGVILVVGAGGTPVPSSDGNAGGTSSFGNLVSAPGGGGGPWFALFTPNGNSGQGPPGPKASGGNIVNAAGQPGQNGLLLATGAMSGLGAPSFFGGGGTNTSRGNGSPGNSPGAGGSGAAADNQGTGPYSGGPGADGMVMIEEFA